VTLAGWTVFLKNIKLGYASQTSSDFIGGFVAPVDLSPFPTSKSGTSRGDNFTPYSNVSYGYSVSGELRLYSGMYTANGGDVVHGPYVISNEAVRLEAGDSISFKWRAEDGGDAYDVYAYLLNVDTGATFELLNQTSQTADSTPMAAKTVTIANGGNYKFVFVSGTFDATFGKAAGASLFIDDVTIAQINPMSINSELIQSLASIIQYNNTADDFTVLSRTISMTANTASNEAVTVTGNILITPVNDPPIDGNEEKRVEKDTILIVTAAGGLLANAIGVHIDAQPIHYIAHFILQRRSRGHSKITTHQPSLRCQSMNQPHRPNL
jgi:hypothetical protein